MTTIPAMHEKKMEKVIAGPGAIIYINHHLKNGVEFGQRVNRSCFDVYTILHIKFLLPKSDKLLQ